MVVLQTGFAVVYLDADKAGAFEVSHVPSWAIEPMILIVCPNVVVTFSLKVTATLEASIAQLVVLGANVALTDLVGSVTLLDRGGFGGVLPELVIFISAQVRYTCGVWNEFHLKDRRVWLEM